MTGLPASSTADSKESSISPILITGAEGFVGRHLIAHLLSDPSAGLRPIIACVHAVEADGNVKLQPKSTGWTGDAIPGRIEIVRLDVSNPDRVSDLLHQVKPAQIYHLAARASGADTDREAVWAVNVEGTRRLLQSAGELPVPPRVLLISTGYVYGDTTRERPAQEEDVITSDGKYGAYTDSKIAMEQAAADYSSMTLIVRAFSHTGPGQAPIFAVPAFAKQLAQIEAGVIDPVLMVGNLEAWRDMLDVRDVVRAYASLMEQGQPGEIVNVGSANPVQIRSVLDTLVAQCRVKVEVKIDPARLRPADIECSTGSPARLKSRTGWTQQYLLEQTLIDTLDYWRSQML